MNNILKPSLSDYIRCVYSEDEIKYMANFMTDVGFLNSHDILHIHNNFTVDLDAMNKRIINHPGYRQRLRVGMYEADAYAYAAVDLVAKDIVSELDSL